MGVINNKNNPTLRTQLSPIILQFFRQQWIGAEVEINNIHHLLQK